MIEKYGADTVRLYTLFIGPPEKDAEWSDRGVEGANRFLKRVWNLLDIAGSASVSGGNEEAEEALIRKMHQTIKKVTEDIDGAFHFNTAISAIMELVNQVYSGISEKGKMCYTKACLEEVLKNTAFLIAPFVPHIAEEIHAIMGGVNGMFGENWPSYDENMLRSDTVTVPVQINGKLRNTLKMPVDMSEEEIKTSVLSDDKISKCLDGKSVRKWIILPNKLINMVV